MCTTNSVKSLALVLGCVSTKVRQRRPIEVPNVYKSCVCVVCVLFDRPEVSLECAPARAEGSVCFLGSLLFGIRASYDVRELGNVGGCVKHRELCFHRVVRKCMCCQ